MCILGVIAYGVFKQPNVIVKVVKEKEEPKAEPIVIPELPEEKIKQIKERAGQIEIERNKKADEPPKIYGEYYRKMKEPVPWSKHRIEDSYLISNMGNVWDDKRKKLVAIYRSGNDMVVSLRTKDGNKATRRVKILVATTFIGVQNIFEYKVVNCDNNIKNCAASNLRWKKIER